VTSPAPAAPLARFFFFFFLLAALDPAPFIVAAVPECAGPVGGGGGGAGCLPFALAVEAIDALKTRESVARG